MKRLAFLVLLCFLFIGCAEKRGDNELFFDIDQLIDNQIVILEESGATLDKKARVGDATDQSSFAPDSAGWANELDAFRQISTMNKPIYKEAYKVEEGLDDVRSNLKIKRLTTERNVPVKILSIYYQENVEKIRRIEAVITDQNALFFASKKLTLQFEDHQAKPALSQYSIHGVQKMLLRDTVDFSIDSRIIY